MIPNQRYYRWKKIDGAWVTRAEDWIAVASKHGKRWHLQFASNLTTVTVDGLDSMHDCDALTAMISLYSADWPGELTDTTLPPGAYL